MDRSKIRFVVLTGALLVLVGAATAHATDGQPLVVAQDNSATDTTSLTSSSAVTAGAAALAVTNTNGVGLTSTAASSVAVCGHSGTSAPICAQATPLGHSGVIGSGPIGVVGYGTSYGVYATSSSGTALFARGSTRIEGSLRVTNAKVKRTTTLGGVVNMKRSGRAVVNAGHISRTVSGLTMSRTSMVIAVAQQRRDGVFVTAAVPSSRGFTIYLNERAPKDTVIAWVVIG